MALMSSYLIKTSNAEEFFNAIRNAQAPERFTNSFLKNLEFSSSNDRMYIGVLKGLGFLDESGAPTERYFHFLDQSQSGTILAQAIREAYEDLFAINRDAHTLEVEDIRGKLKTLTRGSKSDNVIGWMASTFRALCQLADWSPLDVVVKPPPAEASLDTVPPAITPPPNVVAERSSSPLALHYNIQLILPEARDQAVYDALFASLRRHLL